VAFADEIGEGHLFEQWRMQIGGAPDGMKMMGEIIGTITKPRRIAGKTDFAKVPT